MMGDRERHLLSTTGSDRGTAFQGTFDWKEVSFTFRAAADRETVQLCLGKPGTRASGYAWFDDVRISADDWVPGPPEGNHVRIVLEAEDVAAAGLDDDWLAGWIRYLDLVYEQYEDLVGGVPYEGERIEILSVRQYPGGWAVAGNPIRWRKRYVRSVLRAANEKDEWGFGVLHEIGHDVWGIYTLDELARLKKAYPEGR